MLKLLMKLLNFKPREVTWEDYMGGWKEPCDMPEGIDLTLYDASSLKNVTRAQPDSYGMLSGSMVYKKDEFRKV